MKCGSAAEKRVLQWISQQAKNLAAAQKVILFGLRARGDALDRSDFDIAIVTELPAQLGDLIEEAENCPVTLLAFDIVDFNSTTGDFRERILRQGIDITHLENPNQSADQTK